MMATSLLTASCSLDRLERERDDLVAVSVGGERDHGELDVLSELQLGRIVFGQPALDPDHVTELNQTHPERHEVVTGRAGVRGSGWEALCGPRDQGSAAGQQVL